MRVKSHRFLSKSEKFWDNIEGDLLLKFEDINIIGEFDYKIRHNLLVYPGSKLKDINNTAKRTGMELK